MGEHGDSEFVPWSQAMVATKPILDIFRSRGVTDYQKDLDHISEEVRNAAQKIISAKKSTYYGIGMAMVRITRAILGDDHSVLTVSSMLHGSTGNETYTPEPLVSSAGTE